MKKILIFFLLGLGISNASVAGEMAVGFITMLNIPTSGDFVRIQLDQLPIKNPSGCLGAEYYMVEFLGANAAGANRYLSALLSASMAKKKIQLWIDGCTTGSYWGAPRPVARDIYIYP